MRTKIPTKYYSDKFIFTCPVCSQKLKIAKKHEDEIIAGEYLVCSYCTSFIIVIDNDNVKLMTVNDIINLTDDERNSMIRIRKTLKELLDAYGISEEKIKEYQNNG
jgi:uncharacterized protein YbaR (Trm112 family)